jgi:hypothetical protein
MADPIWTVISAETDLEALDCCCSDASRRGGWAVAAVTGRGVPATLTHVGVGSGGDQHQPHGHRRRQRRQRPDVGLPLAHHP